MNNDQNLWQREEQFWLGDADFYERTLGPDVLMVLPQPAGVLNRADTIQSIGSGTRWQTVAFGDQHLAYPNPDTAVLVYTVRADRGSPDSGYTAQCSSTYSRLHNSWQLVLHHQTPTGLPGGRPT